MPNEKSWWLNAAKVVENDYGTQVDYEERFFICPECGEPIYEEDYNDIDDYYYEGGDGSCHCPVCENDLYD